MNAGVRSGLITAPVIISRDHHDCGSVDSPFRETSSIRDGSMYTADMAVQNVIGDACRGATWVSLHNGGGTGWGESINGGFGLVLDGSNDADLRLRQMLHFDVYNGIARRAWSGNPHAIQTVQREMRRLHGSLTADGQDGHADSSNNAKSEDNGAAQQDTLRVTLPYSVTDSNWQ
jgi:urocanate hydratase